MNVAELIEYLLDFPPTHQIYLATPDATEFSSCTELLSETEIDGFVDLTDVAPGIWLVMDDGN